MRVSARYVVGVWDLFLSARKFAGKRGKERSVVKKKKKNKTSVGRSGVDWDKGGLRVCHCTKAGRGTLILISYTCN